MSTEVKNGDYGAIVKKCVQRAAFVSDVMFLIAKPYKNYNEVESRGTIDGVAVTNLDDARTMVKRNLPDPHMVGDIHDGARVMLDDLHNDLSRLLEAMEAEVQKSA